MVVLGFEASLPSGVRLGPRPYREYAILDKGVGSVPDFADSVPDFAELPLPPVTRVGEGPGSRAGSCA